MSSPTTMKAATLHRYGDPDVFELAEIARPEPAAGEVSIRVQAAGINPVDVKTRRGQGVAGRLKGFPVILGWDVAGVVEQTGQRVHPSTLDAHVCSDVDERFTVSSTGCGLSA